MRTRPLAILLAAVGFALVGAGIFAMNSERLDQQQAENEASRRNFESDWEAQERVCIEDAACDMAKFEAQRENAEAAYTQPHASVTAHKLVRGGVGFAISATGMMLVAWATSFRTTRKPAA
jgi:hypothetical protein